MVWMFLGVLLVATLTAEVTANLTVERIDDRITTVGDLFGKDVVTLAGTTSADFLAVNGIPARAVAAPADGYRAAADGSADAFVYDAAILRYLVSTGSGGVVLAGPILQPESYGIALPSGSPRVEAVNRALLALREDGTYDRLVTAYFG